MHFAWVNALHLILDVAQKIWALFLLDRFNQLLGGLNIGVGLNSFISLSD